jgi:hypothetical protein
MQETKKGSEGGNRQLRRPATLARTMSHDKGDDVAGRQILEIQVAVVDRKPALDERAHQVKVGARRDSCQTPLDGQVPTKSIQYCIDWAEIFIVNLPSDYTKPLKIIEDRL